MSETLPTDHALQVLLCDADGCLFPSEDPAYEASTGVVNALLEELGVPRRYTAAELRRDYTGRNFRATVPLLCSENGVGLSPASLDRWTDVERDVVTEHLRRVLQEDPEVARPLGRLAGAFDVAVVSSSASKRVAACLDATALSGFVRDGRLFSAEDSLPTPLSKPDPAIYRHAGTVMGVTGGAALAIEDSEVGVLAAAAAGFPVVGLVQFVPSGEVEEHAAKLRAAGACAIVTSWDSLAAQLLAGDLLAG